MSLQHIKEFDLSTRLYAINPHTFRSSKTGRVESGTFAGTPVFKVTIEAVWFQKDSDDNVIVALGTLWDYQTSEQAPAIEDFMREYSNASYGGKAIATWNGEKLWTGEPTHAVARKSIIDRLTPILANYPDIPEGWYGWFALKDDF